MSAFTDLVGNLSLGLSVALSLKNLGLCFLGCLIGTLIGVLPGVGPIATITMLLPITFGLDPVGALIMLAGIYYGAQYGGSTTAILVNIPGEATSVVTTLDGHQMAKQGRAGVALGIAAMGSFFAGCVATIVIAALAAPLTAMALAVRPGRLLRPHGARPHVRGCAGAGFCAEGHCRDPRRHSALYGRDRPRKRGGAAHLRLDGDFRWSRRGRHRHGYVRVC